MAAQSSIFGNDQMTFALTLYESLKRSIFTLAVFFMSLNGIMYLWKEVYNEPTPLNFTSFVSTLSDSFVANKTNKIPNHHMDCKIFVYNVSQLMHYISLNTMINYAVLSHPLRTYNINEADLFYFPSKSTCYDEKCKNLMLDIYANIIQQQGGEIKIKNNISNHFTSLWRPNDYYFSLGDPWFRDQPFMQTKNITKLTVENQKAIYDKGWLEIPYISKFIEHPSHSIEQFHYRSNKTRKYLISGFFNKRPYAPTKRLRNKLTTQCSNAPDNVCFFSSVDKNASWIDIYMESTFVLQPQGDTKTRKAVYDALLVGAIPVIFDIRTFSLDPLFQIDFIKYPIYVLIDIKKVVRGRVNVIKVLSSISDEEIAAIRHNIKNYIHRVRYYDYRYRYSVWHKDDALDWVLNYLCQNAKGLLSNTTINAYGERRKTMRNPSLNPRSNIHNLMRRINNSELLVEQH